MSGRRIRNLLMLAAVAAIGYWIYEDRPTMSGIVDSITNPLFGSKAAVKSSETNRVSEEAGATLAEQASDARVGMLHEGMSRDEVRDLLGSPDKIAEETRDGVHRISWTYPRRLVVFQDNRVVSITVR